MESKVKSNPTMRSQFDRRTMLKVAATAAAATTLGTVSKRSTFAAPALLQGSTIVLGVTSDDAPKIQPLLDDYQSANNVTIQVEQGPYSDFQSKLITNLTQGTGAYDVVSMDDPWMPQFAGGEFITSGTTIMQRIARWNGSAWSAVANGMNLPVRALGVYNDGGGTRLYAGGDFSFAGGVPAQHVARYNGTSWSAVGTGLPNGNVACFGAHNDGSGNRLWAGGTFFDTQAPYSFLARWDGATWSSVGQSPDSEVRALIDWFTPLPSGSAMFAGGTFTKAGGFASRRIAKWDDDQSPPKKYCTSKVNSQGCTPQINSVGVPSTTAGSGFTISATSVLAKVPGLLFYGKNGMQEMPFQGGWLCVVPPNVRIAAQNSGPGTGCQGSFLTDFNAYIASGADAGLVPGVSVACQWWSRDPGFPAPNNTSLTNALQFFLCQ